MRRARDRRQAAPHTASIWQRSIPTSRTGGGAMVGSFVRRLTPAWLALLLLLGCAAPAAPAPARPAAPTVAAPAPQAGSAPAAAQPTRAPTFEDARLPAPVTVKFGYTPLLAGGPVFVGLERGYFEALNINLDMI